MKYLVLMNLFCLLGVNTSIASFFSSDKVDPEFVVIAHRGASGYLPEHTLEGVAMAHAWGVDFIEPDVVMTKDNQLVVLHDVHVDSTTNVKSIFPNRMRKDGRYFAIDFTLAELNKLRVTERVKVKDGTRYFPKRFPLNKAKFEIPTFAEFIELVQGLNQSTGKKVGIYPEIKNPEFHIKEGKDIAKVFIQVMRKYGYEKSRNAYIQCFWPATLKRLKNEFKTKIPLIQLIADNSWKETSADYTKMITKQGLVEVSKYASGIGPWIPQVIDKKHSVTKLVLWAHQAGLSVHAYTHRSEVVSKNFKNEKEFFDLIVKEAKVDGLFSDFADKLINYKMNN